MAVAAETLITTLLLIVAMSGGNPTCPDICKCPIVYRADCLNLSLTRVPSDLNSEIMFLNASNNHLSMITKSHLGNNIQHIRILDLSYNKISLIENGAMKDMKQLIFLYLNGNEITTLDRNVFEYNSRLEFLKLDNNVLIIPSEKPFLNLPSLRSLEIASCNIRILPEMSFVNLQNLQHLTISHNRLLSLEPGVFLPLKHLKSLYLSGNLLKTLPEDIFVSLKELDILDLSNNQLHALNSHNFAVFENIYLLDLSFNKLKSLEVRTFTSMVNLKRLHLRKNIIDSVNEKLFSNLTNLTHLDLSGNHLKDFHFRTVCRLDELIYLKISGNRLSCDCMLWQLWKWSAEKNATIHASCEDSGFEFSAFEFEELRKNKSCNATMCELKMNSELPREIFAPLYAYIIIGFGILLTVVATVLTVWAVCRYRGEFCRKKKTQVSATQHSMNTMIYINRHHVEQPEDYQVRQLELQHELHRRHRENLMRNHEHSSSLRTLSERDQGNHNIRHSYHEQRLPTVADEEREWFNADTLPSTNRTSNFLPNRSIPIRSDSSERSDTSMSEPRLKEQPKFGSNILEEDTSTPKGSTSVLCPLPRQARGSLILEFSSESDLPEDNIENKL